MEPDPAKTKRHYRTALVGLLALAIGAFVYAQLFKPSMVPVVKLAVAIPLSGEDEVSGNELKQGAELAELEIRDQGLVAGFRLEVDIYDDESTLTGAKEVAYRIVADPRVIAVLGHFSSGNTLAALPIYRDAGLPVLMPVATTTEITQGDRFPNAFRMPPNNAAQAQTVVNFVVDTLKAKESSSSMIGPSTEET